ncbi:MAG: beta-lactamase family protein [Chthonomonas sp.]|nr:beta-lactamase family protein [Chthonomonas sp.]
MTKLLAVEEVLKDCILQKAFPCAAYAFGTASHAFIGAVGRHTYDPASSIITEYSIFDIASVTKVIGTTSVAMVLYQQGKLDLDLPVCEILPEFASNGKQSITPRMLLSHSSGLIPHRRYDQLTHDPDEAWWMVMHETPMTPPGKAFAYSCVGFLTLYQILCKLIMGSNYDSASNEHRARVYNAFLYTEVLMRLGMNHTLHNPTAPKSLTAPPTEIPPGERDPIQGYVHDENCRFFGGISGNAGLFSPIADVSRFCQAILNNGAGVFKPDVLAEWCTPQDPAVSSRGLGWDTKSPSGSSAGSVLSHRSIGHTGFTGTSLWIDPENAIFVALLTNRIYPTRENGQLDEIRPRFADVCANILLSHMR